jgi:Ca2+/Na+ antiporter
MIFIKESSMFGFSSKEPLMTEIIFSILMFSLSLMLIVGTIFKIIGSLIQMIVNIICFIVYLIEKFKRKREMPTNGYVKID